MSYVFYYLGLYLVGKFIDVNYGIDNLKYILPMAIFLVVPKSMPFFKYVGGVLPCRLGLVLQFLMYFLVCMKLKSFPEVLRGCQYATSGLEEFCTIDSSADMNALVKVTKIICKRVFGILKVYLNFNLLCLDRLWTICDPQGGAAVATSSFFFGKQETQLNRVEHLLRDSCDLASEIMSSNEWTRFFITDVNSELWF